MNYFGVSGSDMEVAPSHLSALIANWFEMNVSGNINLHFLKLDLFLLDEKQFQKLRARERCIYDAATFSIVSRLKTHLGGTLQTLSAFDSTLDLYLKSLESALSDEERTRLLVRLAQFLQFIEALEHQIEACPEYSIELPKASVLFLLKNKRPFEEWFAGMRMRVIKACLLVGLEEMAYFQAKRVCI